MYTGRDVRFTSIIRVKVYIHLGEAKNAIKAKVGLMRDYDCKIKYRQGKTDVLTDASSQMRC